MNHGITRIIITDQTNGRGAWRFEQARAMHSAAITLYRTIFDRLGMTLMPGELDLRVSKAEFEAGYDYALGIDLIFTFADGQETTMQEKFLTYHESTVTVEYMQNPKTGEQGDWFKMKPDYYFVGYHRDPRPREFQEWCLLNWPLTRQMSQQGKIDWLLRANKYDGAQANFKYVHFSKIPPDCVVHGQWSGQEHLGRTKQDTKELVQKHYEQRAEQMLLFDDGILPTVANYGDYRPKGIRP